MNRWTALDRAKQLLADWRVQVKIRRKSVKMRYEIVTYGSLASGDFSVPLNPVVRARGSSWESALRGLEQDLAASGSRE